MTVKKVRDAISEIAAIFGAAGAKTASKELGALSQALEGGDEKSVTEFFSGLQQRLSRGKASPRVSTPKKPLAKPAASTDQAYIDEYVRRLDNAGTNASDFQTVFSEIQRDKLVRKREADAIAAAYTKGRLTWPTKRDALEAIEAAFRDRAYQAVKMLQVDKASRF